MPPSNTWAPEHVGAAVRIILSNGLALLPTEAHHAPIKTILVPTDFSAPAERALAYARSLADAYGASLHLLHVIEDPFAGGVYIARSARRPDISNISTTVARPLARC